MVSCDWSIAESRQPYHTQIEEDSRVYMQLKMLQAYCSTTGQRSAAADTSILALRLYANGTRRGRVYLKVPAVEQNMLNVSCLDEFQLQIPRLCMDKFVLKVNDGPRLSCRLDRCMIGTS